MQTVVMQPPPVVVPQQQRSLMNVNAIRGLGKFLLLTCSHEILH